MARDKLGQVVQLVAAAAAPQRSDRELLEGFVTAQDQTAFALLVQRYGPLVLGVCRRVLQDNHEAEDACQATFLILSRKAGSVRWHDTVRGWLYRVAYRVAREARARRARRRHHEQAAGLLPRPAGADLTWQEVAGVLDDELNRLPAKYRDVLVLCYLEGKTRDEAAEQLGWGIGGVKKRLERGRELLRRRLRSRGLPLSAALLASLLDQHAAPAAVPALTLTQALRWVTAPPEAIPGPVLSLVEGVMKAMLLSKLKMVAAVALLVALLGTGLAVVLTGSAAVALAPAEVDRPTNQLKPGQLTVSAPDKHGLVTMFRPLVTQLGPGDPLKVGLHWATEKGPIPTTFDDKTLAGSKVLRDATLNSMTFTIDTPQGKRLTLRPKVELPPGVTHPPAFLYQASTYVLTLTEAGFEEAGLCKGSWTDNQKAALSAPGVYTIQVSGTLVRDKDDPIPFASGSIAVELGAAGLKPLSQVETTAQKALEGKGHKLYPGKSVVTEDQAGNRLLRFSGPSQAGPVGLGRAEWSRNDYTVAVKPDGTVAAISQKTVGTCIARGTLVDGPDGPVAIENIREGDRVWGYDLDRGQRVLTTVRLVRRGLAQETLLFGGTLRVTAEHPVFAGGTWKHAGMITAQERLLAVDLKAVLAGVPQRLDQAIAIFDLTVDEPHNFFAGGFLVHNKSRIWTASMDDVWYQLWPLPEAKGK